MLLAELAEKLSAVTRISLREAVLGYTGVVLSPSAHAHFTLNRIAGLHIQLGLAVAQALLGVLPGAGELHRAQNFDKPPGSMA